MSCGVSENKGKRHRTDLPKSRHRRGVPRSGEMVWQQPPGEGGAEPMPTLEPAAPTGVPRAGVWEPLGPAAKSSTELVLTALWTLLPCIM